MASLALSSALGACASWRTGGEVSPACRPGAPACPIELVFTANRSEVSGTLSPGQSSVSYAFKVGGPTHLQWSLSGPAVRVVLTRPDGNADGPGLAADVALTAAGRYLFSVSSNTMADNIYGTYRLVMRLSP